MADKIVAFIRFMLVQKTSKGGEKVNIDKRHVRTEIPTSSL